MIRKLLLLLLVNTPIHKFLKFFLVPDFRFHFSKKKIEVLKSVDYEVRKHTWISLHKWKNFIYEIPNEFFPFQSLELFLVAKGSPHSKLQVQIYKHDTAINEKILLYSEEIPFSKIQRGKNKLSFQKRILKQSQKVFISFELKNSSFVDFLFLLVRVSRVPFHFVEKHYNKRRFSYSKYRPCTFI